MEDLIGLIGLIGAAMVSGAPCTANLSALSFPMRQVARAAANLYRDGRRRAGYTDSGSWFLAGECLPFQHVEQTVPETVVEGMLIPSHTTHLFRFHSSVSIEAGDALFMRVGNYPGSVWLVDGAPARTTWMAQVCEVAVSRLLLPPVAIEPALAGMR
jgi:hypothetical protein